MILKIKISDNPQINYLLQQGKNICNPLYTIKALLMLGSKMTCQYGICASNWNKSVAAKKTYQFLFHQPLPLQMTSTSKRDATVNKGNHGFFYIILIFFCARMDQSFHFTDLPKKKKTVLLEGNGRLWLMTG